MIPGLVDLIAGPLIVEPVNWTVVFSRRARTRLQHLLIIGRYKHVRAYAYVPFLHVWVFYDVHLRGTSIVVAADGPPANQMIAIWIEDADLVQISVNKDGINRLSWPILGFCVPAMKRLLGIRSGTLRPDGFYRDCLRNGGVPFEAEHGRHTVTSTIHPATA